MKSERSPASDSTTILPSIEPIGAVQSCNQSVPEKDLIRSLLYHFHKRDQIHFNTFELPLAVEFALDGSLLDWTRFVTRRP